ncbi:hypothetical protein RIVM261_083580 [Rivularia sp. IAM M-261]|nr:hypothetical protein RIVM261_083580 [Rivularia sp. IAM M-261]
MNNPNDNKSYREQQESYTDSNGNTHIKRTSETVNNSTPSNYQSGYVHGQATERGYQEERLARQDEDSTSRGLILGFLLALVGLIGGAFWYFNQNNTASETVTPPSTTAPVVPATTPTPIPTVTQQSQTKIIERTKEVPVPVTKEVPVIKEVPVPVVVPQQAPAQTNTTPNINITVPPQPSSTKPSPSTQKEAPKPSSNSTNTNETTNSTTTTPENSFPDTNKPATSTEPQTNVAPSSN